MCGSDKTPVARKRVIVKMGSTAVADIIRRLGKACDVCKRGFAGRDGICVGKRGRAAGFLGGAELSLGRSRVGSNSRVVITRYNSDGAVFHASGACRCAKNRLMRIASRSASIRGKERTFMRRGRRGGG